MEGLKLDICQKDGCCRCKDSVWRWRFQNGSRINGIDEGSSVWNSVQTIGKTIIDECNNSIVLDEGGKDDKTLTA